MPWAKVLFSLLGGGISCALGESPIFVVGGG